MSKLGMLMGKEKMYHHLRQFNFGEKTGIELPGEINGIFRPLKQWSKYSLVSVSIGHELAVTPLQFITAFCSIPNDGLLQKPRIVESIIGIDGETIKKDLNSTHKIRRVIDENIARNIMNPILKKVVTDGTGKNANLLEYDVAGKTGTSQKAQDSGGRYSHDKYVGSFIAYAPAENPRVCVLVMINEPKNGAYYGGTVSAPVVREIIRRSLLYLGIEPTKFQMTM